LQIKKNRKDKKNEERKKKKKTARPNCTAKKKKKKKKKKKSGGKGKKKKKKKKKKHSAPTMPIRGRTWTDFFSYKSAKMVNFHSAKLGITHIFLSLVITAYILIYVIWMERGYQATDDAIGNVFVKVKGTAVARTPPAVSAAARAGNGGVAQVWDAVDAVWPPTENGAVFITTNHVTTWQTRKTVPGRDPATEACALAGGCEGGRPTKNGIMTGACDDATGFCWLDAWAPFEDDAPPKNYIDGVGDFTVFVRETVAFRRFGVTTTNVATGSAPVRGDSLFTVSDILKQVNLTLADVRDAGCVIGLQSVWDCDLDYGIGGCHPKRRYLRLDDPKSNVSSGFNFRREEPYYTPEQPGGTEHRRLHKAIGVRLLFSVQGTGSKFSVIPLLTNLGVGLGLLGLATAAADFIALTFMSNKTFYQKFKYEEVVDPSNEAAQKLIHPGGRPSYGSDA
jgi:P2X purinoceptor 4